MATQWAPMTKKKAADLKRDLKQAMLKIAEKHGCKVGYVSDQVTGGSTDSSITFQVSVYVKDT